MDVSNIYSLVSMSDVMCASDLLAWHDSSADRTPAAVSTTTDSVCLQTLSTTRNRLRFALATTTVGIVH